MPQIDIRLAGADLAEVRRLCRAYRALLAERTADRPEILDRYYRADDYEPLLARLPDLHARPDGAIFVAELNGKIAACGMTHRIGPGTCEIKRVFTDEAARGHGLARQLCLAAMEQSRADGYGEMKLDTMRTLPEAIALYRGLGFTPCAPFYDLPPEFEGYVEFYGRAL